MHYQKNTHSNSEVINFQKSTPTSSNCAGHKKISLGLWFILVACAAATPHYTPETNADLNLNVNVTLPIPHELPGKIIKGGRDIGRDIASPKKGCDVTPIQGDNCHGRCVVVPKSCPMPLGYGIPCGSDGWLRNKYCAYDLNGWCSGDKVPHSCEQDKGPVNRVIPRTANPKQRY